MQYKLSILKHEHNGKLWISFVGSIPLELGFIAPQGQDLTAEYIESQMMLPAGYRSVKTRYFETEQDAKDAAQKLGYDL